MISRLVSMMSPEVYGNDEAKLELLLTAVRGAPKQKDNWHRRYWINTGLVEDKGTTKTTLLYDAIKLIPGSQSVSGQHSTGAFPRLEPRPSLGSLSSLYRRAWPHGMLHSRITIAAISESSHRLSFCRRYWLPRRRQQCGVG